MGCLSAGTALLLLTHGGLTAEGGRTAEADNAVGQASLCPCATGLELAGTAQDWDQSLSPLSTWGSPISDVHLLTPTCPPTDLP